MDLDPLMQPSGFSAINILPKQFNQAHRVLEFNVYDSHGGCDCYVRGFIARTMVVTQAKANSTGLIVGTKAGESGEILMFRPFSGAQKEKVFEVNSALAAAVHHIITVDSYLYIQVTPDALSYMDSSEQGARPFATLALCGA